MNAALSELRSPSYARLWVACRRALEQRGRQLVGAIATSTYQPNEKRALHALLGTGSSRVGLEELDRCLRDAVGMGLVAWLESIGPPVRDRLAERTAVQQRRDAAEALVYDHAVAMRPWFAQWLYVVRRDGVLATAVRLEERRYLQAALDVLEVVLGGGHERVPFATVVAAATGDTKRLSSATVRAFVEQALALEVGMDRPTKGAERRVLWRQFGIVVDDVSSDVLVLNLNPIGSSPLAGWLREASVIGEPLRVTLRQLERFPLEFVPSSVSSFSLAVSVCENPSVVMDAASRFGPDSAPLMCTEGVASDAFSTLAAGVRRAGISVRVHADFDAAGCAIVARTIDTLGAVPWRFGAQDYVDGLETYGRRMVLPLAKGIPSATPWDLALAPLIASEGKAIYEELVVEDLLADLSVRNSL